MSIYKQFLLYFSLFLFAKSSLAQDKPIGYWQSHLPYNSAAGVATDGMNLYTICQQGFFTFSNNGDLTPYSKVEGMSDIGMVYEAYDAGTSTTVLAYQNSNIDLFKDNTFYNIPDLKIKVVAGSKNINHIYTENGIAYLSTDIGILLIDLNKKEIEGAYTFYINNQAVPINGLASSGHYFYAITTKGIFKGDKNNPNLQNFAVWQRIDSTHACRYISSLGNTLFVADSKRLYTIDSDTLQLLYSTPNTLNHIDAVSDGLWVIDYIDTLHHGQVRKMNSAFQFIDSFLSKGNVKQVVEKKDGSVWVADSLFGLCKRMPDHTMEIYNPDGPYRSTAFDMYANNSDLWIMYGGFTDLYRTQFNQGGFAELKNDKWTSYTYQNDLLYDSVIDFVAVTKSPIDGTIYAGSFFNGLFVLKPDGSTQLINKTVFDLSGIVGGYSILGLAFDHNNTLWVSTFGAPHELYAMTTDGNWYKYALNYTRNIPYSGGPMVVDDNNYKWYICSNGGANGGGVIVYDDANTPEQPSDDQSRNLTAGVGFGNLPSNNTLSIAKDKNNDIWVGTDNGIAIINCGSNIFNGCDAQIPIVQYDQYAGYLFAGENVRSIAIDGANRKWVGTDNGVWLLSPDAGKIIYRFTVDNSPLPSNKVQKITIDGVTGDVYIGTEQGLVVYRSTSTDGGETNSNVISYPNPVPSGYKGTVAIRGLVANADVRITDVSGQLVYRTTALGGQAVWSGLDYTGHRPQSGVYLIFVANSDGSQTYAGKMVFLQ